MCLDGSYAAQRRRLLALEAQALAIRAAASIDPLVRTKLLLESDLLMQASRESAEHPVQDVDADIAAIRQGFEQRSPPTEGYRTLGVLLGRGWQRFVHVMQRGFRGSRLDPGASG